MTHTATPWTQDVDHQNKPNNLITDADNNVVAMSEWHPEGINDWNTSVANAAFIVRACNAHADLLEAAKGITASVLANYHDEAVEGKITVTLDADDMDDLIAVVANAQYGGTMNTRCKYCGRPYLRINGKWIMAKHAPGCPANDADDTAKIKELKKATA